MNLLLNSANYILSELGLMFNAYYITNYYGWCYIKQERFVIIQGLIKEFQNNKLNGAESRKASPRYSASGMNAVLG